MDHLSVEAAVDMYETERLHEDVPGTTIVTGRGRFRASVRRCRRRADQSDAGVRQQDVEAPLDGAGGDDEVRVQQEGDRCGDVREAGVDCNGKSGIAIHRDDGGAVCACDGDGVVLGAVVDDDRVSDVRERTQRGVKLQRGVPRDHDDVDVRVLLVRGSHAGAVKVLVVGTGGELAGSGITTLADQMVRTLKSMGHEPTRLVAGARLRKRPNRLNLENIRAVLTEAVAVAWTTRRTEADVVWLHTMGVPTLPAIRTLVQVLAVRAVRRRIIVEFHAFGVADQVAQARFLQRAVLRLVGRLSSRLVALHPGDADSLRTQIGTGDIVVLPNWVEVADEPTPLPPGPPFTAVFVGGLVERKGVSHLIKAMRLLADAPIHLRLVGGAGDDGEAAAVALRDAALDLAQAGRVRFVGELDASGVRSELRRAHLFVLPSRSEGTPMAMLEALAEGRPLLVGDAGNMAEIVRATGCGAVIASQEPAVIAEAIRELIGDPDRLADQGVRGHQAAVDRFSAAAASEALSKILGDLTGLRPECGGFRAGN